MERRELLDSLVTTEQRGKGASLASPAPTVFRACPEPTARKENREPREHAAVTASPAPGASPESLV